MNIDSKLDVLDQIYRIYDEFAGELDVACKRYCAQCCTCNVTLTTLEGYKIVAHLISSKKLDLFKKVKKASYKNRFQPQITTNRLADLCVEGKDLPDEKSNHMWGSCPLLTGNECPIYTVRPFGCRCFVSRHNCKEKGYADIDSFVITVNTVFLQYIEHIDAQGFSGNLTDILRVMESKNHHEFYGKNVLNAPDNGLISNQPLNVLLIPPEHRVKIKPILQALQRINVKKCEVN